MKTRLTLAALAATSIFGGLSATAALGVAASGPATSGPICVTVAPIYVLGQQVTPGILECLPT